MNFLFFMERYPIMSQQDNYRRIIEQREKDALSDNENRALNKRFVDGSIARLRTENKNKLDHSGRSEFIEKSDHRLLKTIEAKNVQEITPKYKSLSELNAYKENAWKGLEETSLGKRLLEKVGGREIVKENMQIGLKPFLTKTANYCESIEENRPTEEGNLVHRVAELYYLEKQPKKIIEGKKFVEQNVYYKQKGIIKHGEIDYVSMKSDNSVLIIDYKRVDLGKFEKTVEGRRWAIWAKKNVGSNFRELIREGSGPHFMDLRKELPPAEIREGLKVYMERSGKKYQDQLDRYRRLFSEGSGVPLEKISTTVVPYYVVGK